MVQKFIGYRNGKPINAYKAIYLRDVTREISTAFGDAEIFDYPDPNIALPIFPKKNSREKGTAYYSYYNETPSELRTRNDEFMIGSDMTLTHKLFTQIFANLEEFDITFYANGKWQVVQLYVKSGTAEHYVRDSETGHYYFTDVYLELEGTYPYHYFYEWNGHLALEVKVSHGVNKVKKEDLNRLGIPVFEISFKETTVNRIESYQERTITEDFFEKLKQRYGQPFREKTWTRSGKLLGKCRQMPEFEEKFNMIFDFEQQIEELENNIKDLNQKTLDMQSKNDSKHKEFEEQLIKEAQEFNTAIEKRKKQVVELETNAELLVKNAQNKKAEIEGSYYYKAAELSNLSQIKKDRDKFENQSTMRYLKIKQRDRVILSLYKRNLIQRILNKDVEAPPLEEFK
ncbi:hypothetical protein KF134_1822 [Lactococcus lactis subsp. lactis]|uniref:hypothetical protein n=1 Tax=Lactococcus lactis TaxID=1358 RepID=UPI00071C88B7|nr:hypothetical protein [Lactococcus lactis]KST91116.1 hypothetical protein KF134_1822 [Lactococcus lactis subsp. lactis]